MIEKGRPRKLVFRSGSSFTLPPFSVNDDPANPGALASSAGDPSFVSRQGGRGSLRSLEQAQVE
jgi:hypothetical protein